AARSALRSSSVLLRVFGSAATITSSDAPTADASADAEPPPGVGSLELNASRRSVTDLSTSMNDASFFDYGCDGFGAHADQIDSGTVDDDGVHLLARLDAADAGVAIERIRGVDRRGDERFLERQAHGEAGQRHRERHRRRISGARVDVGGERD